MAVRTPARAAIGLAIAAGLVLPWRGSAQRINAADKQLEGVEIVERLNEPVPLNLPFVDEDGKDVTLQQYFTGDKPVVLQLGYYECPMLCTLVLNGLVEGMKGLDWSPDKEFRVLSLSINPLETPALARLKKQNYLRDYGRPEAMRGWRFLTGQEKNIRAVADAVGFHYKYNPVDQQYSHLAALMVLTPQGRVSRYLYGVQFPTKTLRMALLEASEGKIGTTLDRFIVYCHRYDPASGSYALAAMKLMRMGGGLTLLALGIALAALWRREMKRRRSEAGAPPLAQPGTKAL